MTKTDDNQPQPPLVSVVVQEFEFPSHFFGRLRHLIHNIAGRWAIRYIVQQQNLINTELNLTNIRIKETLQEVDTDLMQTHKQLAKLTTVVIQQKQQISDLEARLAQLEK